MHEPPLFINLLLKLCYVKQTQKYLTVPFHIYFNLNLFCFLKKKKMNRINSLLHRQWRHTALYYLEARHWLSLYRTVENESRSSFVLKLLYNPQLLLFCVSLTYAHDNKNINDDDNNNTKYLLILYCKQRMSGWKPETNECCCVTRF